MGRLAPHQPFLQSGAAQRGSTQHSGLVLRIQTQREAKATISLGCQSGFTEQPQGLFSYTCRQLLNYTFPLSKIISSLTSLLWETQKVHT